MRREVLLLDEMIGAAEQIIEVVDGVSLEELEDDRDGRDAMLWNYTVLDEAAAQLPAEFVALHEQVPWRRPAQLRNRIVHGYWSIDLSILVRNARDQLPEFVAQLRSIRADLDE